MGHYCRTGRPREQRPPVERSVVGAGGGAGKAIDARLKPFQHDQKFSPERPAPHTLEVAPERRPTTGGPVSRGAERANGHVPGKLQHERATRGPNSGVEMNVAKTPKFLGAAGRAVPEMGGPWSQLGKAIDGLRKAIKAEDSPPKRARLEQDLNGLLAKRSREFPLGPVAPLSFAQNLALRQREQELPPTLDVLMTTIHDILMSDAGNKAVLLDQAFSEFTVVISP